MKKNALRTALAVWLAWQVPATAVAYRDPFLLLAGPLRPAYQPVPVAAKQTVPSRIHEPVAHSQRPRGLNRKLRKKMVVVHLRDGGAYQGKLVKLTQESLHLRVPDGRNAKVKRVHRTEIIALTDVASVGRPVSRKLLGKEVGVYLHSGRAYTGRLVELTEESLLLRREDRSQEIALREVARVKRVKGDGLKWWEIVGAAAVGVLLVGAEIAAEEESHCPRP
ncbi:MAG: hypothetical protein ACE5MH_08210 [Terriglobia bacterium]